jgi:hypothetical protein
MPSRFISIGQRIAGAEHENGRERDDGSHQHGCCPFVLSSTFDRKCGWLLSGKPSLPHPCVSRLDISGQFWQIEQGAGVTVFLQFLPQRDQASWVARQRQRCPFIFFKRFRDQFRHADRHQEAAGDAARERISAAGQNGQSGP